ncbi:MAG: protein kinase [Anaeromyxobacter sp.]
MTANAAQDLAREGLARRLQHPNVVAVLGAGWTRGGPYLVLERLEGETLRDRLARGRPGLDAALEVALAVARALAHVHAQGLIHRDVKPANVFLAADGRPRLLDFGLAHLLRRRRAPSKSGTSGYMAPEQRLGGREDARTDLWALGALLRELFDLSRAPAALAELAAELVQARPEDRPRSADLVVARLLAAGGRAEAAR